MSRKLQVFNFQLVIRWVPRFIILLLILVFTSSLFGQGTRPTGTNSIKEFRASFVKFDITPDNSQNLLGYGARKSTGVHDNIYHRIVVPDDNITQFFLVSTEICIISPVEYNRIAVQIKKEFGISPVNLWWTTIHTHSAPEVGKSGLDVIFMGERYQHEVDAKYTKLLEDKLIEGISESLGKLSPAQLGVGWGLSQANNNRHAKDIDGIESLGMDPDGTGDWPSDFTNYTRTTNTGINLVQLPIRFLKINENMVIWSAPLKLFYEISNEIRDRSLFPYTFYFGHTNGWLGYLLTEKEYKNKGYEPIVSPYTSGAARDLTEVVVSNLHGEIRTHIPDYKHTRNL